MKKQIIILILILSASEVKPQKADNFYELDSIWNAQKENEFYSKLHWVNLSDYWYYKQLSAYLNTKIMDISELIRVINAQQHGLYLHNDERPLDYFYSPDVFFLYTTKYDDRNRLIFLDKKKQQIIDTLIDKTNCDLKYLTNVNSFKGFKWLGQRANRNLCKHFSCWYGTGISISIYSSNGIFVKSIEEFWKYNGENSAAEFLKEIQGKKKTIQQLRNILTKVSQYLVFEDHCKTRASIEGITNKAKEYKKIRREILDVDAVEKREKEWQEDCNTDSKSVKELEEKNRREVEKNKRKR